MPEPEPVIAGGIQEQLEKLMFVAGYVRAGYPEIYNEAIEARNRMIQREEAAS